MTHDSVISCLEIRDLAASDPKTEALILGWKAALFLCSITCSVPLTYCPAVVISVNQAFSVTALPFFKLTLIFLPFDNVRQAFLYERLSYRSVYLFLFLTSETEALSFTV